MLVVIELLFDYISLKSRKFRNIFQGKTSVIICNGRINYHEMVKQRYSLDDLLLTMRQNGISSLDEVEYAFLESNGKLSLFKYDLNKKNKSYPYPVIFDGKVDFDTLNRLSISKKYFYDLLYDNQIDIKQVFYAFYSDKKVYLIEKSNKNTFLNSKYIK